MSLTSPSPTDALTASRLFGAEISCVSNPIVSHDVFEPFGVNVISSKYTSLDAPTGLILNDVLVPVV